MAKIVQVVALATVASAFVTIAPKTSAPATVVNVEAPESYYGGGIESGGFWDPLGLATAEKMYRWRCVEIKHGRIAMLATTGYLYNDLKLTLPGVLSPSANLKFEDVPTGLAALKTVPVAGWFQIIFFIGVMETTVFKQDPTLAPGDIGGKFVRRYADPEEKASKLLSELKNGRLAMMGILGMMATDHLTGQGPVSFLLDFKPPF